MTEHYEYFINGRENIDACANNAMLTTLKSLVKEGFLTKEKATEFSNNYICLVVSPNRNPFSYFFNKIFGKKENDEYRSLIFKVVDLSETEND